MLIRFSCTLKYSDGHYHKPHPCSKLSSQLHVWCSHELDLGTWASCSSSSSAFFQASWPHFSSNISFLHASLKLVWNLFFTIIGLWGTMVFLCDSFNKISWKITLILCVTWFITITYISSFVNHLCQFIYLRSSHLRYLILEFLCIVDMDFVDHSFWKYFLAPLVFKLLAWYFEG